MSQSRDKRTEFCFGCHRPENGGKPGKTKNWKNEKKLENDEDEFLYLFYNIVCEMSVFIQFRVFPISTSVDITVYQYG